MLSLDNGISFTAGFVYGVTSVVVGQPLVTTVQQQCNNSARTVQEQCNNSVTTV
jgi:hypothetical protein